MQRAPTGRGTAICGALLALSIACSLYQFDSSFYGSSFRNAHLWEWQ